MLISFYKEFKLIDLITVKYKQ